MDELQILLGTNCNEVLAASCIYHFLTLQAMLAHHVLQHATVIMVTKLIKSIAINKSRVR